MSSCEQLAAFVDGELSDDQTEAFLQHMAGCAACQAGMEDQVQASLAVSSLHEARGAERRRAFQPVRARGRTRLLVGSAGAAAVILLGLLALGTWWGSLQQGGEDPLLLAKADTRPLEGRLSYPGADRYRKLATMRSGAVGSSVLDHRVLAGLEERGDWHGVATVYLLAGEFGRAEAALDRAPRSPEVDGDRAVAALGKGEPERALSLLEEALEVAPESLRLHWNRGLVLRAMSLELAAAEEFRHVADKGESGWSEEARRLAEGLRVGTTTRKQSWADMNAAGMALALEGKALPASMVHRNPGLTRVFLYHAVRASTSREGVLALLPLAQSLDQVSGTRTASEYVQRVARADFARRGPLAERYRALLADLNALSGSEVEAYLDRLRRSGERDLLLGAILLLRLESRYLQELETLVQESGEPEWYRAPLAKAQAMEELARGDGRRAERRLLEAIEECQGVKLEYRCVALRTQLSSLYTSQDRYHEASVTARVALEAARRSDDWHHEWLLVFQLMASARLNHEPALARAYLDEFLQYDPGKCEHRAEYHHNRALIDMETLDVTSARRELQQARACPAKPTLTEVAVYGDLLRFGATAEEVARAEQRIQELRASKSLTPGQALLLEHVAGRILIEKDRAAGRRLLRELISEAEKLRKTDLDARKAWSYSHHVLVMDAGKAGEFDEAIGFLAAGLERDAPATCLLALAGQDERVLFVARGAQGELRGEYLGQHARPLREEVPPVPAQLLAVFEGCDSVRVLAEPILHGRPGLLAPDRAWSYLVPRAGGRRLPAVEPPSKRVVISDVEPPASLGLPRLLPWNRAPARGEVSLRGPSATPGAVLAEIADATQVEFHAHGLLRSGLSDASFLALSPDSSGRYALTAGDLQGHSLRGAPLVLLAACDANGGAWRYHDVWSLPAAFIQAGARAVVAPTSQVPDVEAGAFFQELLERVEGGASPAQALKETRKAWLQKGPAPWVSDLVVFE